MKSKPIALLVLVTLAAVLAPARAGTASAYGVERERDVVQVLTRSADSTGFGLLCAPARDRGCVLVVYPAGAPIENGETVSVIARAGGGVRHRLEAVTFAGPATRGDARVGVAFRAPPSLVRALGEADTIEIGVERAGRPALAWRFPLDGLDAALASLPGVADAFAHVSVEGAGARRAASAARLD